MAKAKIKPKKKSRIGRRARLFLVMGCLAAAALLASTVLLLVGMLPTLVALVADRSKRRTLVLTVGSMNLAGCAPFLIDLWAKGHTVDVALSLVADPLTVIVMYCAAGAGYIIDWAMSGIVGIVMVQRAGQRVKEIENQHAGLVERWGREVTGEIPVDSYGFPLKDEAEDAPEEGKAEKGQEQERQK